MKTSWRRLEDIFRLRLHKTSSRRLQDVLIETNIFALAMRLQKTSWRRLTKASSRRFQDVFKTSSKNVFKVSSRRLQDVLKTPLRRLGKISLRRFQDVSSSKTVLVNKPSSRIQYGSKRYCKDSYLQKDLPRSHFWEIYRQCTKFQRVIKISQVSVFHFTTPFSGCLQGSI